MKGEKILILNHTRLGDLVQTTPLVRALKAADPTCHITLLANVKFAGILDFVEGIDETIVFDAARFASDDGSEPDLLAVYDAFRGLLDRLERERFDHVVNLSHSKLSAVLTLVCKAPKVSGFGSTDRGERILVGPWLTYFSAMLSFRRESRFNLVDLYLKAGGVAPSPSARLSLTPSPDGERLFEERRAALGVDDATPLIGVQAGASREDRRWPPASFAAVADRLATEREGRAVLLGAASEKRLGDQVAEAMTTGPVNLIGETGLAELVSWVKRLSLLVTNDTGTMHIAAALGVPVVALFFVHARGEETGPYTENALVLQADIACAPCGHQTSCDHFSCLGSTTPDDVIDAARFLLDRTPLPPRSAQRFGQTVALAPSFDEGDRMLDLWPLHRAPLPFSDFVGRILRPVWVSALSAWDDPAAIRVADGAFARLGERMQERYTLPDERAFAHQVARFVADATALATLADEGGRLASSATRAGADLPRIGRELAEYEARVALIGETCPSLLPLAAVYRRRVEGFVGDHPASLVRQGVTACRWLAATARLTARGAAVAEKELMLRATASDTKTSTVESTRNA